MSVTVSNPLNKPQITANTQATRSGLPMGASLLNSTVRFGEQQKPRSGFFKSVVAALSISMASFGLIGLPGCSEVQQHEPTPGVSISLKAKDTNTAHSVDPEVYTDGIVINKTNNKVLGHFNEAGEAFVGNHKVAMTTTEGKIFGFIPDDKNETRAILIGQVDEETGQVKAHDGEELGTITGDHETLNVQQKGAIAALTMFNKTETEVAAQGQVVQAPNGTQNFVPHAAGSNSSNSNFWYWMYMMNNNRHSTVYVPYSAGYSTYRSQYSNHLDSTWRNNPAGNRVGSYGDTSHVSSGGFGDSSKGSSIGKSSSSSSSSTHSFPTFNRSGGG